jgi:tripartite-type tricarboxylate transporter receptor subunit TctC
MSDNYVDLTRRKAVFGTAALAAVPLVATANNFTYPQRPVRIIVPYPPGGSNDVVARLIAQKLGRVLDFV